MKDAEELIQEKEKEIGELRQRTRRKLEEKVV